MHVALKNAFINCIHFFPFSRSLAGVLEHTYISYLYITSKHQIKQSKHFTCQAEASFSLNRPFLVYSRCVQHLCVCNYMVYIAMKSSQLPIWCLGLAQLIQQQSDSELISVSGQTHFLTIICHGLIQEQKNIYYRSSLELFKMFECFWK